MDMIKDGKERTTPRDSSTQSSCCGPSPIQIDDFVPLSAVTKSARSSALMPASHALTSADVWGAFKVRWGVGRMDYRVTPGLYALGEPDESAEVLVTANYKLTFDKLRSSVHGRSYWILVLDTMGINVWCAAGKGTFGTDELVRRIAAVGLGERVSHRRLIIPQLGAPGVRAHEVKRRSGFKVVYGPIEATDIVPFLDAGRVADKTMRRKRFDLRERVVLIPVELVGAFKWVLLAQLVFVLLSGLTRGGAYLQQVASVGPLAFSALLFSLFAGAVFTPILLPYLPGRAFAVKSLPLGVGASAAAWGILGSVDTLVGKLDGAAWMLMGTALAAFFAMNFTGSSTYTSLSGVKKEMRIAVPLEIAGGGMGVILFAVARFVGQG